MENANQRQLGTPEISQQEQRDEGLRRFGRMIEARRTEIGRSARSVAQAVGISTVYLRTLELGINSKTQRPSEPSSQVRTALFEALGLPTTETHEQPNVAMVDTSLEQHGLHLLGQPITLFEDAATGQRREAARMVEIGVVQAPDSSPLFIHRLALARVYADAAQRLVEVRAQIAAEIQRVHASYPIIEGEIVLPQLTQE